MTKFALWPDGTICEEDQIEEMLNSGMSDDFELLEELPPDIMAALGY
jgi:hypothetical protein